MTRPLDLPDFNKPPVKEVVVGIHFDFIEDFKQAYVGLFWESIRSEFGKLQDFPILMHAGGPNSIDTGLDDGLNQATLKQITKTWFLNNDESLLVQLQNNMLTLNWRFVENKEYPHFEILLETFTEVRNKFVEFVKQMDWKLENIRTEVTYVNFVEADFLFNFTKIVNAEPESEIKLSPVPYRQQFAGQFIPEIQNKISGVLDILIAPNISETKDQRGFLFNLSHSSILTNSFSLENINEIYLRSREIIVKSFADWTNDEFHEIWERNQ